MRRIWRLAAAVSLLVLAVPLPAGAVVSLSETTGRVFLLPAGSTVWAQISRGHVLAAGDRVRTDAGSKAAIDFGDGSRIEIGANGAFTLQESAASQSTLQLSVGRLRAWVKHRLGAKFTVRTPNAVCSVRGTEFAVDVNPSGGTRVEMFTGLLAVADNMGNEALLKDGQRVEVTDKGLGKTEGGEQAAAGGGADAKRENAKREVGLEMSKEEVQAAAALEQKNAVYQQGKAIIDVNGKRVRIEQYIVRPAPDQAKLVILNERADRFDFFYYKWIFNKALPTDLAIAFRQLPGCIGAACEYNPLSFETARSNTQDSMVEVASGGHQVDVNNNAVGTGDDVRQAYDQASDSYINLAAGTPFFKTLYNTGRLTFNGVEHYSYTKAAVVGAGDIQNEFSTSIAGGHLAKTFTTKLRNPPLCGPPNCTFKESGVIHEVFYSESDNGKVWDKFDNYIISDEGKVATYEAFGTFSSNVEYKKNLLLWNYQTIVTASEFNGRSIDLSVAPELFIQSGIIP